MLIVDLLVGNGFLYVVDNVLGSIDFWMMYVFVVLVNVIVIYMIFKVIDVDIFDEKGVCVFICDKLYLLILFEIFYSSFFGFYFVVFCFVL